MSAGDRSVSAGSPSGASRSTEARWVVGRSAEAGAVVFVLPGQLRDLTEGRSHVEVPVPATGTLEEAFATLRRAYPAVYDRIFTETGEIRPHINVFVDGDDIRWAGGLDAAVGDGSEVVILPAVSGG